MAYAKADRQNAMSAAAAAWLAAKHILLIGTAFKLLSGADRAASVVRSGETGAACWSPACDLAAGARGRRP